MPPWSALLDALSALATPKSVTIALPPRGSTLSGLMSRWDAAAGKVLLFFGRCAYASALANLAQNPDRRRIPGSSAVPR
jgi:hypothetical protein